MTLLTYQELLDALPVFEDYEMDERDPLPSMEVTLFSEPAKFCNSVRGWPHYTVVDKAFKDLLIPIHIADWHSEDARVGLPALMARLQAL